MLFKKLIFVGSILGGWHPLAMLNYFSVKYLHIKKSGTLAWAVPKLDILGVSKGWYSQTISKHLSVEYLLILKQTGILS